VIQGDGMYTSIAAASVLAKTYRDEYMQRLHKRFKMYAWESNKGYGTPEHRSAIEKHGLCKYHRRSFNIFAAKFYEMHDDDTAEQLQDIPLSDPAMPPIPQIPVLSHAIHQ
jgi:ribonuclease HII